MYKSDQQLDVHASYVPERSKESYRTHFHFKAEILQEMSFRNCSVSIYIYISVKKKSKMIVQLHSSYTYFIFRLFICSLYLEKKTNQKMFENT